MGCVDEHHAAEGAFRETAEPIFLVSVHEQHSLTAIDEFVCDREPGEAASGDDHVGLMCGWH